MTQGPPRHETITSQHADTAGWRSADTIPNSAFVAGLNEANERTRTLADKLKVGWSHSGVLGLGCQSS